MGDCRVCGKDHSKVISDHVEHETEEFICKDTSCKLCAEKRFAKKSDIKSTREVLKKFRNDIATNTHRGVTEGLHFDSEKNRLYLVPPEAMEAIGEILTYGCTKKKPPYPERNWEKGILFSALLGSIERHIIAFKKGEDKDYESGIHPLKHALTDMAFIVTYIERGMTFLDDRPEYLEDGRLDDQVLTKEDITMAVSWAKEKLEMGAPLITEMSLKEEKEGRSKCEGCTKCKRCYRCGDCIQHDPRCACYWAEVGAGKGEKDEE